MPEASLTCHYEIGYRGRDGAQRLISRTITGASPRKAIGFNLAVLTGIGVGGPAGLRLLDLEIEELEWVPRVPLAYPIGPERQMNREGLPVIANTQAWRYSVSLTVGHPDAYIGRNRDAVWAEPLWMRPVLPRDGQLRRPDAPALRVRVGAGTVTDAGNWAARNGLTDEQAVEVLTSCGLAVVTS